MTLKRQLQIVEATLLRVALDHFRWNRRTTARVLGMSYRSLMYKVKRYGIKERSKKGQASPLA